MDASRKHLWEQRSTCTTFYIAYLERVRKTTLIRTSSSIHERCFRRQLDQSCKGAQYLAQAGHPGSGLIWLALREATNIATRTHTRQHRTDRKQHWKALERPLARDTHTFGNRKCWAPLIPKNVQANAAVRIDIGVVDLCRERHLRWLEWVVRWEGNGQEKDTARVWRVALPLVRRRPILPSGT